MSTFQFTKITLGCVLIGLGVALASEGNALGGMQAGVGTFLVAMTVAELSKKL